MVGSAAHLMGMPKRAGRQPLQDGEQAPLPEAVAPIRQLVGAAVEAALHSGLALEGQHEGEGEDLGQIMRLTMGQLEGEQFTGQHRGFEGLGGHLQLEAPTESFMVAC
eukprot:1153237-Pelagomonas_calceolata.AAC.4